MKSRGRSGKTKTYGGSGVGTALGLLTQELTRGSGGIVNQNNHAQRQNKLRPPLSVYEILMLALGIGATTPM
jgi:hypothetical protein